MKIELQEVTTDQLGVFQTFLYDEIRIEFLCLLFWLELNFYKVRIADANSKNWKLIELFFIVYVKIQR